MEAMLAWSWRSQTAGVRLLSRLSWSSLSWMVSAAVFSSTRATRRVPEIGAMSMPWASSQAGAICAGVAPASATTACASSTMARLRSKLSPVKPGLVWRQSSSGMSPGVRIWPIRGRDRRASWAAS
jgi:hypothetical protein